MKKKNHLLRKYTYREFLTLFPYCHSEEQAYQLKQLEKAAKVNVFAGVEVPDLTLVSYGLLDDIAGISRSKDLDAIPAIIARVLDIDKEAVYSGNVFDVFGIAKWLGKEVERINRLFAKIAPSHTPQEIAAGVKSLNFGSFGVLDWYSHRQGISDQNLVRDVPWIRIYTCMKNDNEVAEYKKRLDKEYQKQYKTK